MLPPPFTTGNDLNEDITPIEAGLAWTVGKRRREAFDFLGGQVGCCCWLGLASRFVHPLALPLALALALPPRNWLLA